MDSINKILESGLEREPAYAKKAGIILKRRVGSLIYLSGHGPENQITGVPYYSGRVGEDLSVEEGYLAARECAIILLGALKDAIGNLDKVTGVVKALGLVNCGMEFTEVDSVMDGFSDTIVDVLEERGYHARTVMGTRNMPNNNIPIEIEVIFSVRD